MATYTIPKAMANFETSLASKMSDSATSFTLNRSTDDDGTALSGRFVLTFNEGTSQEEHMIVTLSGASGTVVTRGLSRVDGTTNKSANQFEHQRGDSVKITNFPLVNVLRLLNGDDTFNSVDWTGVQSIAGLSTPTSGETTKAANVEYVNNVSIAGANDATDTVKGIIEMATSAESQSGTDSGGTTAPLVVAPSDIAANTQNQQHVYAADSGAADAYVITLTPAPSAYAAGQRFSFLAANANTGASTLNVNSLGTKTIKKLHDQDLEAGDIEASMIVDVVYDGTNLQMLNPAGTNISAATASAVTTFFDGATDQTTSIYDTAGEDMVAGNLAAVESDGDVYQTRVTAIGTQNTAAAVATSEDFVSGANVYAFNTSDNTDIAFVYIDATNVERIAQVVYDADRLDYSSDTVTNLAFSAFTAKTIQGIELETDKIAVLSEAGGTAEVNAISTLNGTISQGTQQSISTGAGTRAIAKHDSATFVVFTGTSSTTGIQTHKCTVSGVTITVGSPVTMLSTTNDVQQITGAHRFGTTDYYLVNYYDNTDSQHKMLIGEWNSSTGAWTTVGTPVNIGTGVQTGTIGKVTQTADSDNKLFFVWRNSTTLYYNIIARSTTTPSVTVQSSISQRDEGFCLTQIGAYTYAVGAANSGSSDPALNILRVNTDLDTITAVDTVDVSGGDSVLGVAKLTPERLAVLYSDGTDLDTKTIDLTTNIDGVLGFIGADVTDGSTATINVSGSNASQTGLTAGTKYYADLDGAVTTDTATGEVVGRGQSSTKIKIA